MISEVALPFTTDASGDATVTAAFDTIGKVYAVAWTDGDLADGVDAVLSYTGSGRPDQTLLTLTNANDDAWYYPRAAASSSAGAALTAYVEPMVMGKLKVVVSSGGNAKSGAIRVYVES